ncbi:riboflavin synthase [Terrilactibacillus sp. S3-3]|nr:riboflavin synthase [Terrilactibacillus sp. S3-3]
MFTGLVEDIGRVVSIRKQPDAIQLAIAASLLSEGISLGDSIAVNGVCVTVTGQSRATFTADVMPETIKATTLKYLRRGDWVNIERAMKADGRFGGHFVTGHVDGIGRIVKVTPRGNAHYYEIQAEHGLLSGLAKKGSVAVDGTSLTVFQTGETTFTISLIPHTSGHTILGNKRAGDLVNIECDVMQKYIDRRQSIQKEEKKSSTLTYQVLKENGFIN